MDRFMRMGVGMKSVSGNRHAVVMVPLVASLVHVPKSGDWTQTWILFLVPLLIPLEMIRISVTGNGNEHCLRPAHGPLIRDSWNSEWKQTWSMFSWLLLPFHERPRMQWLEEHMIILFVPCLRPYNKIPISMTGNKHHLRLRGFPGLLILTVCFHVAICASIMSWILFYLLFSTEGPWNMIWLNTLVELAHVPLLKSTSESLGLRQEVLKDQSGHDLHLLFVLEQNTFHRLESLWINKTFPFQVYVFITMKSPQTFSSAFQWHAAILFNCDHITAAIW